MEHPTPWSPVDLVSTKPQAKPYRISDAKGKMFAFFSNKEDRDRIIRAVNAEEAHRKDAQTLAFIRELCKVVYFPPHSAYPIEHYQGAGKGCFTMLENIASEKALDMKEGEIESDKA